MMGKMYKIELVKTCKISKTIRFLLLKIILAKTSLSTQHRINWLKPFFKSAKNLSCFKLHKKSCLVNRNPSSVISSKAQNKKYHLNNKTLGCTHHRQLETKIPSSTLSIFMVTRWLEISCWRCFASSGRQFTGFVPACAITPSGTDLKHTAISNCII
jgi:hypothetical protein